MAAKFRFSLGGVDHNLRKMNDKIPRALVAIAGFYAPKMEASAKHNAPWNDRTTNARNGLFAEDYHEGNTVGIVLAHSVDYGIFLETKPRRKGGRPIIAKTIDMWAPRIMKKTHKLIDRLS